MKQAMIKEGECMAKQKANLKEEQSGNIMLITTIVILVLTVVIAACMNVSGMQLDLSMLERNTSNTYYLAKSGVEKQVDAINKSLDVEMTNMVATIANIYITQLAEPSEDADKLEAMEAKSTCTKYNNFYYDSDKLSITSSNVVGGVDVGLKAKLQEQIYNFVRDNYIYQPEIAYDVQSDHADTSHYKTTITINTEALKLADGVTTDQTGFKLIATAETKNAADNTVYDTQTVEARVDLKVPDTLPNEIHEKYTWAANPPEVLNSALISFSDVVVTSGGSLNIQDGDMQVKGGTGQRDYSVDDTNHIQINSGTFADTTQTGGVIVSNGGKLKVENGDIACINNVIATNGWSEDESNTSNYSLATTIAVLNGDIIANTVGLVDDYYDSGKNQSPFNTDKQGTNLVINVANNIFVSNDVMISRWIKNAGINVEGTIFGVNDGSDVGNNIYSTGTNPFIDPNSSSGVFSQGENTTISAYRILVNGQPYITLAQNTLPMKLWESVGEPFDGVALWEGYKDGDESNVNNKTYLDADSPFNTLIARNKIKIASGSENPSSLSYGPGKISANGVTTTGSMISEEVAKKLFMGGLVTGTTTSPNYEINNYTGKGNYTNENYIVQQYKNTAVYYKNARDDYSWYNKPLMYGKTYTTRSNLEEMASNYLGLRAYMTAKRSVFYGKMDDKNIPQLLNFEDVISGLPDAHTDAHAWSYSNPVVVTSGNIEVDVSSFYVNDDGTGNKPYPSIIVHSEGTLTLKATDTTKNEFNGVIISTGDVRISGTIKINGTLIVAGTYESANPTNREVRMRGEWIGGYDPGLVIDSGDDLTITHDPDALLKVNVSEDKLYRQILDALKITNYSGNSDVKKIMGPYSDTKLTYSAGKVFYTTASTLEVQTQNIKAQIKSLKKMR